MYLSKAAIACSLLFLVACGGKGSNTAPKIEEYVVKGDPNLIIAGSKMKPGSPFTVANVDDLNAYSLMSMITFSEKEKAKPGPETQEELEKENAPSEGRDNKTYNLVVKSIDADTYSAEVAESDVQFILKKESNGSLQLSALKSKGVEVALVPLHWSQDKDKSMLSVLARFTDPDGGGTFLIAFYFKHDSEAVKVPLYSKVYRYLAGPGVAVRWAKEKTLNLEICGENEDSETLKNSVNIWSKALEGRLKITLKKAAQFAPFSDLNQHCIYSVDVYDNSPGSLNYGVTPSILDLSAGQFVDSDVIIFKKAFTRTQEILKEKGVSDFGIGLSIDNTKSITYTHELGHLFGLAHQFDGTKSVMSYKFDSPALTDYDLKAIQTLYPNNSKK